jgi:hypothetical protein
LTSRGSQVRSLSRPPPSHRDRTPFSFFALMPPERGLFESRRVSVSVSEGRNAGFCAPVSASKNSVPDSESETRFDDDCVGGWQVVRSLPSPPSSPTKPQIPVPAPDRPFLRGFSPVSLRSFGLRRYLRSLRPILAPCLRIQKFRSPRHSFDGQCRSVAGNFESLGGQKRVVLSPARSYRGFNPRASNCWLHSGGASRSRSTPMPRGKRPSTAARTRSGARNASDIVMLT